MYGIYEIAIVPVKAKSAIILFSLPLEIATAITAPIIAEIPPAKGKIDISDGLHCQK